MIWILGVYGSHLGPILGPFGAHLGSIFNPFGVQLGPIWSQFGTHLGALLGPFLGSILVRGRDLTHSISPNAREDSNGPSYQGGGLHSISLALGSQI